MEPQTQYARSGDVFIAYQVFGSGTPDLVMVPAFLSHLENTWSEPRVVRWLNRLGQHCRVIMFDKRGTGLSDRVAGLPDLEQRMDDVRAVTDAVGSECPALFGLSEGGTMAALYAATNPARCKSLVLWGAFARFQSWYKDEAALERFREYVRTQWGQRGSGAEIAPTLKDDPAFKQFIGRYERLGASPSAVLNLMNMNSQIDVRGVLASIRVPTLIMHRRGDVNVSIEGGRELAAEIPNARFVELPGEDHAPYVGEGAEAIADMIGEFVTGERIEDVGHTTLRR
jgi:pimeloyl-ACP methyl ester carboxylesterase